MGTNNSASNAAAAANANQQRQINQTIAQINSAYSSPSRQDQYAQYGNQVKNYLTGQVNEQEAQTARNLKFAMARSGLQGGSAAVDSNNQLQKDYTKGLLQASQAAQTGQAQLEQADIGAKNALIAQAEQGAYLGSIPQAVSQAAQANLGAAQNYANSSALGNLFGSEAQLYTNNQNATAQRRAQTSPIGSLYG